MEPTLLSIFRLINCYFFLSHTNGIDGEVIYSREFISSVRNLLITKHLLNFEKPIVLFWVDRTNCRIICMCTLKKKNLACQS